MKLQDLAEIMGKTIMEVEQMLKEQDMIELNLNERRGRYNKENDGFRIYE